MTCDAICRIHGYPFQKATNRPPISQHINLLHLVRSVWTISRDLRYAQTLIVTTSVSNRD